VPFDALDGYGVGPRRAECHGIILRRIARIIGPELRGDTVRKPNLQNYIRTLLDQRKLRLHPQGQSGRFLLLRSGIASDGQPGNHYKRQQGDRDTSPRPLRTMHHWACHNPPWLAFVRPISALVTELPPLLVDVPPLPLLADPTAAAPE
jgi:hypothetical protein